jgi:UDPglucose--hexose-1-phosphate uridylyltransferase
MSESFDEQLDRLAGQPHRRHNPLLDEWVLVSAGRSQRPWQGHRETAPQRSTAAYDPECYLCPGNRRAGGEVNPDYDQTFVFTNDFAALRPDAPSIQVDDGLRRAETEPGTCRVLCFSRRHDDSLASMDAADVRRVVDLWADQTAELGTGYQWVQVFENRGEAMGASNPHPHGQIWAGAALPREASREDAAQRAYRDAHERTLLIDVAEEETAGPRIVAENADWLALVPFWAAWPYEILLIARAQVGRLPDLDAGRRDALAAILHELLGGYDRLFEVPFPYSMGWHQAPFREGEGQEHWQLHAHFYPPLLSGSVRKFHVGYELLAETQRDLTAESAAAALREAIGR